VLDGEKRRWTLVRDHVQGDDTKDDTGDEDDCGDQECGEVGVAGGEGVGGDLAKLRFAPPGAQDCRGADDQGGKGQRDQTNIEANARAGGKPVHEMACGLRRLIGGGLNVAEKERNHKKGRGEDQEDFERSDRAFEVHVDFVS
jgi:hypothetical protein